MASNRHAAVWIPASTFATPTSTRPSLRSSPSFPSIIRRTPPRRARDDCAYAPGRGSHGHFRAAEGSLPRGIPPAAPEAGAFQTVLARSSSKRRGLQRDGEGEQIGSKNVSYVGRASRQRAPREWSRQMFGWPTLACLTSPIAGRRSLRTAGARPRSQERVPNTKRSSGRSPMARSAQPELAIRPI